MNTPNETATPMTDASVIKVVRTIAGKIEEHEVVCASGARALERELTKRERELESVRSDRDHLHDLLEASKSERDRLAKKLAEAQAELEPQIDARMRVEKERDQWRECASQLRNALDTCWYAGANCHCETCSSIRLHESLCQPSSSPPPPPTASADSAPEPATESRLRELERAVAELRDRVFDPPFITG